MLVYSHFICRISTAYIGSIICSFFPPLLALGTHFSDHHLSISLSACEQYNSKTWRRYTLCWVPLVIVLSCYRGNVSSRRCYLIICILCQSVGGLLLLLIVLSVKMSHVRDRKLVRCVNKTKFQPAVQLLRETVIRFPHFPHFRVICSHTCTHTANIQNSTLINK